MDYNRSGVTLIEIVSEPVMSSPEEAREYLKQLKSIIQYTGISDLNLEGSCRVDANISIKGHARSEVKNINSFKEVEKALRHEIIRQKNFIRRGKELVQETRHWTGKTTISLRTKEFEKDYRYFPEQDLVPIEIQKSFIEKVEATLPEMPNARSKRFQNKYYLSEFDADNLVLDKDFADFYEEGIKFESGFSKNDYKLYCNWLMNDISGWLNDNNKTIKETDIKPRILVDLLKHINEGKITGKIAKIFVGEMMKGTEILDIMKKSGKMRISDEAKITKIVKEVLKENPEIKEAYKKNPKALQALIGKCMQKTKGQLDPELTRDIALKYI